MAEHIENIHEDDNNNNNQRYT